ncbi:2-amino-4-hydroxy-6-hydroxymethyldihydropteridine diphosphokinase [Oleiagrimonas soli]|uniref:2-amino-4-hydroxy-6-hydroxymethyldihydropteridine pyrophosphokinase n=1 Tax=Oleiagrimonas soli TaxID=1543381 RepID=A0A099CYC7_9GAMM|nr:2-amino-4-hydroxy-6-hydroxymethyldihydropteridine diphosphokinase [Oleiagrimonas soli]KGI78779.1 2-amino-4-hydroxy-6-hydroxymethyldihydropteridine pyrophosphokinase [Oleiagrimonas soli]MBB6184454.1 2-amino-4-hydroxy-6-hydroxymethyldihydropteridine diphosphokinase [Oleiagrimonas soli]
MTAVLLSLGSNIEPERHLRAALAALRERFGALRVSPTYRTASVGFEGDDFLNLGVGLDTDLEPEALNAWLHALEDAQGRRRDGPRFSSRTLDIDIVLFGDRVVNGPGHLQIPRDELRHAFVLKPLADIAPEAVVPGDGRTLAQLWSVHPDHDRAFEACVLEPTATGASASESPSGS